MKELLDLSYDCSYQYPEIKWQIDGFIDNCLKELEKGKDKERTIAKYKRFMDALVAKCDRDE